MGTKITSLTALSSADDADVFPIVDVDAAATKKITWAALKAALSNIGKTQRAQFSYKDADEIYADAGYYDCDGKVAFWSSQLTLQLSGAGADTWYYLYLDYSAITSGVALTATELIFSASAPSWSAAKHGWYNGSDRCIFAVLTDGSNNILEFFHAGDIVLFADQITSDSSVSTSFEDIVLDIPACTTLGMVTFHQSSGGEDTQRNAYWRTNGQAGSTGHLVTGTREIEGSGQNADNSTLVITDSSQTIEVKLSGANQTLTIYTDGWKFGVGM